MIHNFCVRFLLLHRKIREVCRDLAWPREVAMELQLDTCILLMPSAKVCKLRQSNNSDRPSRHMVTLRNNFSILERLLSLIPVYIFHAYSFYRPPETHIHRKLLLHVYLLQSSPWKHEIKKIIIIKIRKFKIFYFFSVLLDIEQFYDYKYYKLKVILSNQISYRFPYAHFLISAPAIDN